MVCFNAGKMNVSQSLLWQKQFKESVFPLSIFELLSRSWFSDISTKGHQLQRPPMEAAQPASEFSASLLAGRLWSWSLEAIKIPMWPPVTSHEAHQFAFRRDFWWFFLMFGCSGGYAGG